ASGRRPSRNLPSDSLLALELSGAQAMSDRMDRRDFFRVSAGSAATAVATGAASECDAATQVNPVSAATGQRPYLTNPPDFRDVSRGNPRPFTLKGEQLVQARLTPETWRLEILSDGTTQIETPRALAKGTAIDLAALENLGKQHSRKFL